MDKSDLIGKRVRGTNNDSQAEGELIRINERHITCPYKIRWIDFDGMEQEDWFHDITPLPADKALLPGMLVRIQDSDIDGHGELMGRFEEDTMVGSVVEGYGVKLVEPLTPAEIQAFAEKAEEYHDR